MTNTAALGYRPNRKIKTDAPVNTRININQGGTRKKPVTLAPVPWEKKQ